ncbi:MAG: Hsp20/alpha crystallin family protein [Thioalkalivibrionaceae bacterium]
MNRVIHSNAVNPWALMGQMLREFDRQTGSDEPAVTADFSPAVDIFERDDAYVLRADLPGVPADAIDIQMEQGVLTIRGERKIETHEQDGHIKRSERVHGVFYRRFALPESVDAENISARANQGVLELIIPKQPQVLPRKISVQSGSA